MYIRAKSRRWGASLDSMPAATELHKRMITATDDVFDRAEAEGTTLREAAFDIAVERVAHAAEIRGYV